MYLVTYRIHRLLVALVALMLAACIDNNNGEPTVGANQIPTIYGAPHTSVIAGDAYSFSPSASDGDGDPMTFSIINMPSWASFNSSTGILFGNPDSSDMGIYENILISVSDGNASAYLTPFSISVDSTYETPPNGADISINYPFPQHQSYIDANKPDRYLQEEMDAHVTTFYDVWKDDYLADAGLDGLERSMYRVAFEKRGGSNYDTTVSEGQGYGMIIVAMMAGYDSDAHELFDGLWYFVKEHPSHIINDFMAWRVSDTSVSGDNDSAFDGDADIAYALLLANKQWGSSGEVNYALEAKTMIEAIRENTIGINSNLPLMGDWQRGSTNKYDEFSNRTSDFMLPNFRAFLKHTNNLKWEEVVYSAQNVLTRMQVEFSPRTGLVSDFISLGSGQDRAQVPASSGFLEGPYDGEYYYNACRVPLRVGLDALLYNDESSKQIIGNISTWIEGAAGGNPYGLNAGYYLDGTPISGGNYFSSAFVAPLGVAAMNVKGQQEWLNNIYDSIYNVHQGYYEDSINLLSLLIMTGNYWSI